MMPKRWREWLSAHKTDLGMIAAIILFFVAFFWRGLFGGLFLVDGDALYYSYPLRTVAWEMIKQGTLPLWTPYIFSGYPLLSMAQLALAYPLTWGYLFLPGHWAEHLFVLAPYLLTPLFTYAFARTTGRSPLAALLAGLTFSYGGLMFSGIGMTGFLPNALIWPPLVLLAAERARTRAFAPCLLLATVAYTLSVLTGIGQGFTYAGALALAYAAFLGLTATRLAGGERNLPWRNWERWKPLAVVAGAILLASGVAAFQIRESLRAARRSVRGVLSYEMFTSGSFTFDYAWKSWVELSGLWGDASSYTTALAGIFAVAALVFAWRDKQDKGQRDLRIFFWGLVAVTAFVLMMGGNTPLYRLVYHIPAINRFRVAFRHSYELTFALGILGAYGWDALQLRLSRSQSAKADRQEWLRLLLAVGFFGLSAIIGLWWWLKLMQMNAESQLIFKNLHVDYLLGKALFVVVGLSAIGLLWRLRRSSLRTALLAVMVALFCFIEPYYFFVRWFVPNYYSVDRFSYLAPVTRFLQQFPAEQNRIFTQGTSFSKLPLIDPVNWPVMARLHDVAGYEPLMLERYSWALNGVRPYGDINRSPFLEVDYSLFENRSHVLDILNATHVVTYSSLSYMPVTYAEKDGVKLAGNSLNIDLSAEEPQKFSSQTETADTLAIVSATADSGHFTDGTPVANISVHTMDGRVIKRELRMGIDTAEWAHERADVRAGVKHKLAQTYEDTPGDEQNSFRAYNYWTKIKLDAPVRIERIEIIKTRPDVVVFISKVSTYDSTKQLSAPVMTYPMLSPDRWETVYQKDNVTALHNKRALPRAWLVPEVEAVSITEAYLRVRGDSKTPFDPRRTALLDVAPDKLPPLSGQPLAPDSNARIVTYEPTRLVIETQTDKPALLVVSEIAYPGWTARLDGAPTEIYTTDFILRGVVVPPGKHRVEMEFTVPSARIGVLISLATLLLVGGVAWSAVRNRRSSEA